jgi:hypothetical protein
MGLLSCAGSSSRTGALNAAVDKAAVVGLDPGAACRWVGLRHTVAWVVRALTEAVAALDTHALLVPAAPHSMRGAPVTERHSSSTWLQPTAAQRVARRFQARFQHKE